MRRLGSDRLCSGAAGGNRGSASPDPPKPGHPFGGGRVGTEVLAERRLVAVQVLETLEQANARQGMVARGVCQAGAEFVGLEFAFLGIGAR